MKSQFAAWFESEDAIAKLDNHAELVARADYATTIGWYVSRYGEYGRPRGSTFLDWRMALRRKLNGDTR